MCFVRECIDFILVQSVYYYIFTQISACVTVLLIQEMLWIEQYCGYFHHSCPGHSVHSGVVRRKPSTSLMQQGAGMFLQVALPASSQKVCKVDSPGGFAP